MSYSLADNVFSSGIGENQSLSPFAVSLEEDSWQVLHHIKVLFISHSHQMAEPLYKCVADESRSQWWVNDWCIMGK